jgi:hypothetical protein
MAGMPVLQEQKPALRDPSGGFAVKTICSVVFSCEFF